MDQRVRTSEWWCIIIIIINIYIALFFEITQYVWNLDDSDSLIHHNASSTKVTYMSSRFSRNSEANASEILENIEQVFPWYC